MPLVGTNREKAGKSQTSMILKNSRPKAIYIPLCEQLDRVCVGCTRAYTRHRTCIARPRSELIRPPARVPEAKSTLGDNG